MTPRKKAISLGLSTYEGSCHHHGVTQKWVSNDTCVECNKAGTRKHRAAHKDAYRVKRNAWADANPKRAMLQGARRRAIQSGVPFDLHFDDFDIPNICPALGIPLLRKDNLNSAPSLDRIEGHKGYVKGNVVVVSYAANRAKGNLSVDQLSQIVDFYKRIMP